MNVFKDFKFEILKVIENLQGEGLLPVDLDCGRVACEPPREKAHGDISTNAALVLSKAAAKNPRELAELLATPGWRVTILRA